MSEDWDAIAAEISDALSEVGFTSCLEKPSSTQPDTPWDEADAGDPDRSDVTVVQDVERVRNADGTLIGQSIRTLTISTASAVPEKNNRIAVGVETSTATDQSNWDVIAEVRPLSPGGVALLFEVDLES